MKLWDMALDYGPRGTDSLQALYRELTRPQFQPGICHLCGVTMDVSYYTLSHTPLSDPDQIIYSLSSATSDIAYAMPILVWLAVPLNFALLYHVQ